MAADKFACDGKAFSLAAGEGIGGLVFVCKAGLAEGDGGAGGALVVFECVVGDGGGEDLFEGKVGGEAVKGRRLQGRQRSAWLNLLF